ncbi:MAG TPA: recombinase family protein [Ktedonobacterales bacterium]
MPHERLAAIYARVSTEEQTKAQVTSTATQVARCRDKAAALGIPVAADDSGLIVEEQHSGTDLRWEGTKFMALVRRAEAGEFTDLMCYDIDRFCRGGSDTYGAQRSLFIGAGVTVHFVTLELGDHNPFAGGITALLADAAQAERDKTRERSMRVRTDVAAAGFITPGSIPPFGFRWIEDTTEVTKRNHYRKIGLEPDPVTGPALLHITEHVANGGSMYEARRWLMDNQIPTPRGGLLWYQSAITRILHNPTNFGARRSFGTRVVQRPGGTHRPASLKTRTMQVPRPVEEQYPVNSEYVTAIPGLTQELWQRALDQLAQNKAFSLRNAHWTLEERTQHALLRGPMIRCAVCGHALTLILHHDKNTAGETIDRYRYICRHGDTPFQEKGGGVFIAAPKLDALVWDTAVQCLRDPDFFTRVLAENDAANGPAVRVASLTRQLQEASTARDKLLRQLERLEPDDELVADYQVKLRTNKAMREELTRDLEAAQAAAVAEDVRRATIARFTRYADAERERLDAYTPVQRHMLLRALRTRVVLDRGNTLSRVSLTFDLRHLPAKAGEAFNFPLPTDEEIGYVDTADTADTVIDLSNVPAVDILESEGEIGEIVKRSEN